MTVSLSQEGQRFVAEQIAAGEFPSAEDVVDAGLQLLKARKDIRAAVIAGVEQADRGQVTPFNAAETLARVRA